MNSRSLRSSSWTSGATSPLTSQTLARTEGWALYVLPASVTGRENSRTLVDGWYGGIGPRFGLAYSVNDKTVVRASVARSFGVVKTVTGSTHFEGAISIFRPDVNGRGHYPRVPARHRSAAISQPPSMNPAFSNGNNTAYWNNEAVRLPESYDWTLSIQRQLSSSLIFETSYNATIGAHLVSGILRMNQVPFSAFQRYGLSVLQSNITFSRGCGCWHSEAVPEFQRKCGSSTSPLSSVPGHSYACGSRRQERPFQLPRLDRKAGETLLWRIDVEHLLRVLEADH